LKKLSHSAITKNPVCVNTPRYSFKAPFTCSNGFRTQEWSKLARDDVSRLRKTSPEVSYFGWFIYFFIFAWLSWQSSEVCGLTPSPRTHRVADKERPTTATTNPRSVILHHARDALFIGRGHRRPAGLTRPFLGRIPLYFILGKFTNLDIYKICGF
jgi:hypothetical protein